MLFNMLSKMLLDWMDMSDLLTRFRHGRTRIGLGRMGRGLLCLAAVVFLATCQPDEEGAELSGPIGPGSGGPPVEEASVVTDPITAADGATLGSLSFDSGYFTKLFSGGEADEIHYIYADSSESLAVTVLRISGRPDTPCRFSAALLARDEGYSIQASGDVSNEQNLEFHQVNLAVGDTLQRFYCTELQPNVGIQINTTSLGGDQLDYEQVHHLLNSVSN